MSRVWLVYKESGAFGDYQRVVHDVCGTTSRAGISKMHLEADIQNVKNTYEKEFGSKYEDDLELLLEYSSIDVDSERYQTISDRIFDFELQNPLLNIHNIYIEEREVKY